MAPVELTFKVGVAAVLAVENNTPIMAPADKVNPLQVTTFAAVEAVVLEVPYHVPCVGIVTALS